MEKLLELLEQEEESAAPYALLCVAGVYAVTLKLTAGLILILLAKPAYMLLREKRQKDIGIYLVMGLVTIVPWLVRTVILSGYLLYPFPSLDLFDMDWKIPAAEAALDAAEIRTWGRGINNAALVDLPVWEWFPGWFRESLPVVGKALVAADIVCLPVFIALLAVQFRRGGYVGCGEDAERAASGACHGACILWFLAALGALLRYGYAYVLLVVMITSGILCDNLIKYFDKRQKKDMIKKAAVLGVCALWVFSAVKLASLARHIMINQPKRRMCGSRIMETTRWRAMRLREFHFTIRYMVTGRGMTIFHPFRGRSRFYSEVSRSKRDFIRKNRRWNKGIKRN